jgi:iron complex outermembrane recepter protein
MNKALELQRTAIARPWWPREIGSWRAAAVMLSAIACAALPTGGAIAQPAATSAAPSASASPPSNQDGLAEIIVTAEKRAQDIEKVPVAVTALSMREMENAGVQSVIDLGSVAPGVEISTIGTAAAVFVTIRGLSNENYNNGNPEVAPYIDGVYVGGTAGLGNAFYDLDRVEVLRGPQGTLYGRNSTGGNINVVTADPLPTFAASTHFSYGNFNDVEVRGMINVPITEQLAVRVAVFEHRNDGLYDSLGTTSQNYGIADDYGGRITALWTPVDSFSWRLSLDEFQNGGTPNPEIASGPNGQPADGLPVYTRAIPSVPTPKNDVQSFMVRSRMNLQLGDALNLTYIAGDQNIHWLTQSVETNDVYGGRRDNNATNYSHELDLNWDVGGLRNLFGANYYHMRQGAFADYYLYGYGLFDEANYGGPQNSTTEAWGVFDQATFNVTDSLQLIGGIRYSREQDSIAQNQAYLCPLLTTLPLTISNYYVPSCISTYNSNLSATFPDTTWRVGLNYSITNDMSAYATVTTGFKSGGFNAGIPSQPTYAPEKVTNYEIGLKGRTMENRLSFSSDIYFMNYRDIQVYQIVGVNALTTNAAGAHIYGTENEAHWRVTHADRLDGFFTWTHGTYSRYLDAVDQITNIVYPDISGNSLPHTPRFSARLQYAHDFTLPNSSTLTPSAASYWQSGNYLRGLNLPIDYVGAYSKSQLGLAWVDPSAHWTVRAYVNNLEDHAIRTSALAALGYYFADYAPPRTYGVRLEYTY